MYQALLLLAQEGAPQGGMIQFLIPLLLCFMLFYLLVLRPANRRQQQERDNLLKTLDKNDKVVTTGGIYGTVVSVSDKEDEVTVKVDDNVRLRMTKGSIYRNITKEDAARAAKETKPTKEGAA
jgi:preprotein translocase subunit YajC